MDTLRYEEKGEEVKMLQKTLKEQGFFKGDIDGKFFKDVKEAVLYFQKTHLGPDGEFLVVDGIVGKATWWALLNPVGDAQKSHLPRSIPEGLTPLRVKQLEIALKEHEKGVREIPDGSNWGDEVAKYGGVKGAPWCCYFWSWCNRQCFGSYSLEAKFGRCKSAWKRAQKLGFVKKKGGYIPIPGDAFMLFYRDKKGKLTGVGHIGFVMRVEVKDGKAVAINTIEGNTSNRVKIGKRDLTRDEIVGFINPFPEDEQPADWEKGLVHSGSVGKDSTRAIKIRRKTMNRKAVCVGISTFKESVITPLPGCVNDARLLANTLQERYGFSGDDVRLLTDEQATRKAILAQLGWLVEGASSGDVLVYTVASHGTWTVDVSGDEEEGRDEVFVPYDYDSARGIGILDDEIGKILGQVPDGARLYCILDTCHSGTSTRLMPTREQQELAPINRFLPLRRRR